MAKINVVLIDKDELYLNRLTNYLIDKADSFNVSSFSSPEILDEFLVNKSNKVDVLVLPMDFANDSIKQLTIPAKVILSEGPGSKLEGFESVYKYQKADKFLSDILQIFSEKTGRTDAVTRGNKNTKIVGVYSPVGGSGKTTIALALSTLCASFGLKVFYLNFEKLNSSDAFFAPAPQGSMSDVFLALKTKGANIGLKLIANCYTDPATKINYINSPDSAMEYNELTESEITRLLQEFDNLGKYDLVFVDMHSAFDKFNTDILTCCDQILMPFCQDSLSLVKMTAFLREFKFHDSLSSLTPKIHMIANKTDANGTAVIQSELVPKRAIEAYIPYSPVFADIKNLSYAGNLNKTGLDHLVNTLCNLNEGWGR